MTFYPKNGEKKIKFFLFCDKIKIPCSCTAVDENVLKNQQVLRQTKARINLSQGPYSYILILISPCEEMQF